MYYGKGWTYFAKKFTTLTAPIPIEKKRIPWFYQLHIDKKKFVAAIFLLPPIVIAKNSFPKCFSPWAVIRNKMKMYGPMHMFVLMLYLLHICRQFSPPVPTQFNCVALWIPHQWTDHKICFHSPEKYGKNGTLWTINQSFFRPILPRYYTKGFSSP